MYTILIDEAGDTGLQDVRADPSHGPTQYFVLCAVIFREENRAILEREINQLPFQRQTLHANKLRHFEKVYFCREISKLPIGMLGVVSNKLTLLDYLPQARNTPTHYYNKCIQYLLEMIGSCALVFKINPQRLKILLETRNQQYSSLISFVQEIQRNPLHRRAELMRKLNAFSISNAKKSDDLCFSLADMGANALFSAVRRDPRTFSLSETRYIQELSPVFLSDLNGRIVPSGIKPIHSMSDLALPEETSIALQSLTNPNKDYQRL